MVYCYVELRNYKQLARLRAAGLPGIESGLLGILGSRKSTFAAAGPGAWLMELGPEEDLDASGTAANLLRLLDFLESRRDELFGFGLLVARAPSQAAADLMREMLQEAEQEEGLWLAPECAGLFADFLAFDQAGPLRRVSGPNQMPQQDLAVEDTPRPWFREALVARVLDIISERLNSEDSGILHLHGPPGVGKTALLRKAAQRLLGGGRELSIIRPHSLFKRKSPLHPFLNSLSPALLASTPRHLAGAEKVAWADVSGLLARLAGQEDGAERLHPDRVLEDFAIGYRLCLTAWVRSAREKQLPAIFLCDGVDGYHPDARRFAARLIGDFLACADFVPAVSTTEGLPEEMAGLRVRSLFLHPLGRRELRSLCAHLYPGLALPEALLRRLRRKSSGLYPSALSYLQYLHRAGFIRFAAERREWTFAASADVSLPANPLSASWYLIRTLPDDAFLLLYAVSLAGGLLDRRGFLSFLSGVGIDPVAAEKTLAGLVTAGLVAEESSLIPRFPALRRRLENDLGVEGTEFRDRFIAYLGGLWESGKYPHAVLLFTFLARGGRTDLALRVLPEIIRRKLDEGDIAGARTFCDPDRLEFSSEPTSSQRVEITAMMAVGRLRAALLEEDREGAEAARREVLEVTRTGCGADLAGEAWIELSRHSLGRGDSSSSREEAKRALLLFQEQRPDRSGRAESGERASYLWLGATMMADGKLSEAIEYVSLSERLCREAGDMAGALRAGGYLATALFVNGRFTQCLAAIERGLAAARQVCRRGSELFLLFLKARTQLVLGAHEACGVTLQECLCLTELYSLRAPVPVLRAWLGRAALYAGEVEHGMRVLQALEPSREVFLFLAEGCLFSEDLPGASHHLDRALSLEAEFRFPAAETTSWEDGFASVEGRCFRLSREGAFLRRSLSALRACLLGLRGSTPEAIRELRRLTRSERSVEEDPNGYWYDYLYSLVLPESGPEDVDDKETVLGKAVKSLQERASRIDAPAERSSFLARNAWNRRIMDEARERKLV